MAKKKADPERPALKGWKAIAEFLGQPTATAQNWAREGMPVRRQGRYVMALPDELESWVTRETGAREPLRVMTDDTDLAAELKRGLSAVRRRRSAA